MAKSRAASSPERKEPEGADHHDREGTDHADAEERVATNRRTADRPGARRRKTEEHRAGVASTLVGGGLARAALRHAIQR